MSKRRYTRQSAWPGLLLFGVVAFTLWQVAHLPCLLLASLLCVGLLAGEWRRGHWGREQ